MNLSMNMLQNDMLVSAATSSYEALSTMLEFRPFWIIFGLSKEYKFVTRWLGYDICQRLNTWHNNLAGVMPQLGML